MGSAAAGNVEVGFAKLQGEDFEYYMQTYSIILGRSTKNSTVDVDLSHLGCGKNISRHHARIFYDFTLRRFSLEVFGRNGCLLEGVLHLPGNPPAKLDSQDLLQIGDKKFYFLLPVRSILGGQLGPRDYVSGARKAVVPPHHNYHFASTAAAGSRALVKKGRREYDEEDYEDEDEDEDDSGRGGSGKKLMRRDGYERFGYRRGSGGKAGSLG